MKEFLKFIFVYFTGFGMTCLEFLKFAITDFGWFALRYIACIIFIFIWAILQIFVIFFSKVFRKKWYNNFSIWYEKIVLEKIWYDANDWNQ